MKGLAVWSDGRSGNRGPMCVMQELQKDFKEASRQGTDLIQMKKAVAKSLEEKADHISSQT